MARLLPETELQTDAIGKHLMAIVADNLQT
jgi:hypothetical protein